MYLFKELFPVEEASIEVKYLEELVSNQQLEMLLNVAFHGETVNKTKINFNPKLSS